MVYLVFIATWAIVVPCLVGVFRYTQIPMQFKPLVYLLWLGLATEVLALISVKMFRNNMAVYNSYMLFDFLMMVWLFYRWGAFGRLPKWVLYGVASLYIVVWVFDNFLLHNASQVNIIFRMAYSVTLVLLGIDQLSRIYINNKGYLSRNPYLYTCLAVIFYYTYSTFVALFANSSLFGPSPSLWRHTLVVYAVVNGGTNILYTIALLWMRRKARYT
jgi:hypothetical protein